MEGAREGLLLSWEQSSPDREEVHPGASLLKQKVGRFVGVR